MTLIELLNDSQVVATTAMCNENKHSVMKAYYNGEAIAYIDATKLVKEELRRLCNKFQNGNLSVDDFGVVL